MFMRGKHSGIVITVNIFDLYAPMIVEAESIQFTAYTKS